MHISWQVWSTEWLSSKQCVLNICVSDDTEGREVRGEANIQRVSENQEQNKPPCCFSLPGCERHPALTASQMCDLTNVSDWSWWSSKIFWKIIWVCVHACMDGCAHTHWAFLCHNTGTGTWGVVGLAMCSSWVLSHLIFFSQGHRWRDSVHAFTCK